MSTPRRSRLRSAAGAVVARMFTVYGPGQRPDMAFASWIDAIAREEPIRWCAAEGARRAFTFVGDAVRGLVAALERGRAGRAYNKAHITAACGLRAERHLGYRPLTPLRDGIRAQVAVSLALAPAG